MTIPPPALFDLVRAFRGAALTYFHQAMEFRRRRDFETARRLLAVSRRFSKRAESGKWEVS